MTKVNRKRVGRGESAGQVATGGSPTTTTGGGARTRRPVPVKGAKQGARRRQGAPSVRAGKAPKPAPAKPVMKVRELSPQALCGPRTTVTQLFRVVETADGVERTHLVFFDRHGWYCEHGPGCPAVGEVMRLARAS